MHVKIRNIRQKLVFANIKLFSKLCYSYQNSVFENPHELGIGSFIVSVNGSFIGACISSFTGSVSGLFTASRILLCTPSVIHSEGVVNTYGAYCTC